MKSRIIWVGSRQSDIKYAGDFFSGSITLYGDGLSGNVSLCKSLGRRISNNIPSALRDDFMREQIEKQIAEDNSVKFMFYDPHWVLEIEGLRQYRQHYLCINDLQLLKSIESKIRFRTDYSKWIRLVDYTVVDAHELSKELLDELFSRLGSPMVFQKEISNGGSGTFLVHESDSEFMLSHKTEDTKFIVSKYKEDNIPINVHLIIYDEQIVLLPPSVQIVELENNCLLYKGGDYLSFRAISEAKKNQFFTQAKRLAKILQQKGYRGICGIDALIDKKGKLFIMEINPRFQGSSNILDKALTEQKFDCLAKMNYDAFYKASAVNLDENSIDVNYSSYSLINNDFGNKTLSNPNFKEEMGCIACEMDGLDKSQIVGEDIYCCKLILDRPIFGGKL